MDTGSTVSTVSYSFFQEHLRHTSPLHELDLLLDIECADGQQLPYSGYSEVELLLPGQATTHHCIVLITNDSGYNNEIPLLLGTNILDKVMASLQQDFGERFLQTSQLTTPWYLTL